MGKILIFNAEIKRLKENYDLSTRELMARKKADSCAKAAASRMVEYSPANIYYCPVNLIEIPAKIVADFYGLPLQIMPGFSGLTDAELGGDYLTGIKVEFHWQMLEKLRSVVDSSLDKIIELHKKDSIVIVATKHLCVIMILYMLHMNNSHYEQIEQCDGAINLFEVRSGIPSALYINDTCHMRNLI